MRDKKNLSLHLIVCLFFLCPTGSMFAQQWNPGHTIGTSTGNYNFSGNQVPSQMLEIHPAAIPNTGLTYQWEQSTMPESGFVAINGATASSYNLSAPLTQTLYFRRKTTYPSNNNFIYSNTIKIKLVSVNWEDINYVREHNVTTIGITTWQQVDQLPIGQKLQSTTYMDGLGRSVQSVSRETATPSAGNTLWGDMVQFSEYDQYGREPKKYLPYTTSAQSGKLKTAPVTEQSQYYINNYSETPAYAQISFDNSPLNRLKNIKDPGTVWSASTGKSTDYDVNTAADNVQIFTVDYAQGSSPLWKGAYLTNTLLKLIYKDENGKDVVEFINKSGQTILKKVQLDDTPLNAYQGWICTYFIYDDFGLLRYELQPEAIKYLEANSWSFAGTNGQKVLNDLCFQYDYDEKDRTIWTKNPGAEPMRMIYDIRNRLVFTQDGNQALKSPQEWTGNLYDELDRPVITTLYRTSKTIPQLQSDIDNAVSLTTVAINNASPAINDLIVDKREQSITRYAAKKSIEFISNGSGGFESVTGDEFVAEIDATLSSANMTVTTAIFKNPISSSDLNNASVSTILKYFFYDNYNFTGAKSFDTNFDNALAYNTSDANVIPITVSKRTTGFPTGSMTRVLGSTTFLYTTAYYDDKGWPIQNTTDNIKSGKDVSTYQYHFDGRLLSMHSKHTTAGSGYSNFSTLTKNLFDKIGRISSVQKKYGTNVFKTITSYDYDDVGRIKTKRLDPGYTGSGKNELEALTYTYNIHGNLTGINKEYALKASSYDKWSNFFGLYLGYDNRDNVFNTARLNGQTAGVLWNTQGDDAQRKYDYSYDNSGRLVNTVFKEKQTTSDSWSNTKMDFSVSGNGGKIAYDLNGNLLSMLQKGVMPGLTASVIIDNLQYLYESYSNKLLKVTDNSTLGADNGKQGDFKDGTNTSVDDYVYDANGNLVIDLNKNAKDLPNIAGAHGIRYNHLDKPEEIRIVGKGTIRIVYSASGAKLQRAFIPESGGASTITTYINGFVYQETTTITASSLPKFGSGGSLSFINFEEGRIRVMQPTSQSNGYDALMIDGNMVLPDGKKGVYDYFITDHLANVRMILTEQTHIGSNKLTMETARASSEEPIFGQAGSANEVVQTRFAVNNIPGQTSGGGWQNSNIGSQVSRLGNLAAKKTGPNVLLKVMAGDQLSAMTEYYYQNPVSNSTGSNLVNSVLADLVQSITGSAATNALTKNATTNISTGLGSQLPFRDAVAPDANNTTGTNPKAYLTVLFFDERFNFVAEGSSSQRVQENPGNNASLVLANIKAPKNGFVYVYLSNESNEMVYFDNMQVTHNRGRIIEENHYYSYGLKIAAISSKKLGDVNEGTLQNNYQYQGMFSEMDDDIGWNDFALRNYDPQIGRFVQQDPYQQFASPYTGLGNDPVNSIDPTGGVSWPPPGLGQAAEYIQQGGMMAEVIISSSKTVSTAVKPIISLSSISLRIITQALYSAITIINTSVNTGQVGEIIQQQKTTKVSSYSYEKLEDGWKWVENGKKIIDQEKTLKEFRGRKTNTCAIRFSYAVNVAGYSIPKKVKGISKDRIWLKKEGDKGNYLIAATEVQTYLSGIEAPTVVKLNITTEAEVDELIAEIHANTSYGKAIMVIVAGDQNVYGASGHVDLLYRDFMQDISMYGNHGDDLGPYLKRPNNLKAKHSVYIWRISE